MAIDEQSSASAVVDAKSIADAGLGEEILRPLRVRLDLLAQLAHVDAQVLCVGEVAPQLLEQKTVGEDLADAVNPQAQQLVFLGRELDLLLAGPDDPAHQIDRQLADAED